MDDEEETYRLWKIRKTIMQVGYITYVLQTSIHSVLHTISVSLAYRSLGLITLN